MPSRVVTAILAVLAIAHVRAGADWPQFLGPDRNGSYRGAPIVTTFPAGGPKRVWSRKLGQGLSGPVVVGTQVIVFHRVGDREVVESLDAASGKTRWQYGYPTAYRDDFGFDEGPRAVPVVADGVVYTFGAEGHLQALSLERGEPLWSEQTARQFGVPKGFFGAAGSPLVEGGRLIANVGGSKAGIIAFNARKGAVEWTATNDAASYSSPVGATIAGQRYAIFFTRNGLVGTRPGQRRREVPAGLAGPRQRVGQRRHANRRRQPDLHFRRVRARRRGAAARRRDPDRALVVERCAVEPLRDQRLRGRRAVWLPRPPGIRPEPSCGRFRTGRVRWSEEKFGAGTVTLAGNQLVVMRENGELLLAPARRRHSSQPRAPPCWAHGPRLSGVGRGISLRPQRRHAGVPGSAAG